MAKIGAECGEKPSFAEKLGFYLNASKCGTNSLMTIAIKTSELSNIAPRNRAGIILKTQ